MPIYELPGYYAELKAPRGHTDVLLITDAICRIPASGMELFNAWKREASVKVSGRIIGDRAGDLVKVCDECHEVSMVDAGSPVVGKLLSI